MLDSGDQTAGISGHALAVEGGIGIGEISKAQAVVNRILKALPIRAEPGSDLVVMPGGSITRLIVGVMQSQQGLELADFKSSSWIYVHIGAEVAILAGDVGLMFMGDQATAISFKNALPTLVLPVLPTNLLAECTAWAPCYGTSVGLGAGGKLAVRVIQSVHLKAAT